MSETTFTAKLTEKELAAIKQATKGADWQAMLQGMFRQAVKRLGKEGSDGLSPKEAAGELGLSVCTVLRYIDQGMFPNAVYLNQRTIRIPRGDIEAMSRDRRMTVAA